MAGSRRGVLLAVAAYVLWGLSALYWPLMEPTGALEILALRILWTPVATLCLLMAVRRGERLRGLLRRPKQAGLLVLAGVLNTVNWGLFIYATTSNRVVDASLGYFITPLVSVGLAIVLLNERLRAARMVALILGAAALVLLALDYGRPPWIALGLAVTFSAYTLIKKYVDTGAIESLMVESAVLFPVALVFTVVIQASGDATFGHVSAANTLLAIGSGFVMMVPMVLYGAAATRIPLSLIGLLQYVEPIVQFLIGLLVFHESVRAVKWLGFAIIWAALLLLSADVLARIRPRLRSSRSAPARRSPPRSAR